MQSRKNADKSIRQISRELKYENRWMKVYEDKVLFPNGKEGIYGVAEKPAFAVIVPFDGKGFYLVEQYRYAIGERSLEFPMGAMEDFDGGITKSAVRELQEECGLSARNIEELGSFYTAIGFSNQEGYVFAATGLSKVANRLDDEESDLECIYVPLEEFKKLMETNSIKDVSTICAWHMVKEKFGL